jgi:DNA-binding MarR family transcriptional regulator
MLRQARLDAPGKLNHVMIQVRKEGQRRAVFRARGKIGLILSREFGTTLAEIARQVEVSTSAISKAIQKMERRISKV